MVLRVGGGVHLSKSLCTRNKRFFNEFCNDDASLNMLSLSLVLVSVGLFTVVSSGDGVGSGQCPQQSPLPYTGLLQNGGGHGNIV